MTPKDGITPRRLLTEHVHSPFPFQTETPRNLKTVLLKIIRLTTCVQSMPCPCYNCMHTWRWT